MPPLGGSSDYELDLELSPLQRLGRWLRSWRGLLLGIAAVLIVLGLWQGRAVYRVIKEWRVSHLLDESADALREGKDEEAFLALRNAFLLIPGHQDVLRGIARYHTDRRESTALTAWQQASTSPGATLQDKVMLCREALRWGALAVVREHLATWGAQPSTAQEPGVLSIQAEIQAIEGRPAEAIRLARESVAQTTHNKAEDGAACRLTLARVLLQAAGTESDVLSWRREALVVLRDLALGTEPTLQDAADILVRLAAQPAVSSLLRELEWDAVVRHVADTPSLPLTLKVSVWDLRLVGQTAEGRQQVMADFVKAFPSPDLAGALEAARWLVRQRENDRVLDLAATKMFFEESWFLVGMDALAGKGDWKEVLARLEPARKPPLSAAVVALFRYRAQKQLGQSVDEEVVWRDVAAKLTSEPVSTQLYAAGYAEQLGRPVESAVIYRRLLSRSNSPTGVRENAGERRKAYLGLLRTSAQSMTLEELAEIYAGLINEFPDMDEARGDLHYVRLLQNKADEAMLSELTALVARHPEMLAMRSTLALAHMKMGRPAAAMEVYAGCTIDWSTAPDRYRAVRVAVLDAAGQRVDADGVRAGLDVAKLRPEERQMAGLSEAVKAP